MKPLLRVLFLIGVSVSYLAYSSEGIYLPTDENLYTKYDTLINSIEIPSNLKLDDGRTASGPQSVRLFNKKNSDSPMLLVGTRSVPMSLKEGDSFLYNSQQGGVILPPGSSASFEIDLKAGDRPEYVSIRPLHSKAGDRLSYELSLDHLKSVWDKNGWQTIYSNSLGCKSERCNASKPYGSFDTIYQAIEYEATPTCSGNGFVLKGTNCEKSFMTEPTERCSNGFTLTNGTCTKVVTSEPILECPNNKYKSGDKCYDSYSSSCPSTHYLSNDSTDGHCYPKYVSVLKGDSCPTSHPFTGGGNSTHTTCYSVDTAGGPGRNARVESWCRPNHNGGGGYQGYPWCYDPTMWEASTKKCRSGGLNSHSGQCESITEKSPLKMCSNGKLNENVCYDTEIKTAQYHCKIGDILKGHSCGRIIQSKGSYVSSLVEKGTTLLKVRKSN